MSKSDFLQIFQDRCFFHQCTDINELDKLMSANKITAYLGFDCTAPALHVGNLMQIMVLRLLQKTGHKPIILVGGGTTKIGDPSGKDEARALLTDEVINRNMEGIKAVLSKFINFGDKAADAILVNNADWLNQINYIEFLRDYGRHFSINRMLTFDSVKLRLEREQNLSFLEFNYMLLQAYDFVELNRKYGCRLQIGGSDQWGNIVNGVELGRRLGTSELFGITTPLLTTASGAKMGKTANGAVWLDASMLSPYEYFQYWRNVDDKDVARFLRIFTELSIDEIKKLSELQGQEINEAKKVLAYEVTKLCHGQNEADIALDTTKKTFDERQLGAGLPTIEINSAELRNGIAAFELFHRAKLAASGGESRRLIRGNGAKVNDELISVETQPITLEHVQAGNIIKLTAGKKNHAIIKVIN